MKLSIVIPIYNEEENIDSLINRLRTVVAQMQIYCEYIFVNDGSKDHSFQLIKNLAVADPAVKYIDFSRNFGHQIAVSAGLDLATGDRVAIIDADLQDPPELIIEMFAKMDQGYEVVYAKRNNRNGESWLKKFTAKVFYRILKSITSVKIPVDTGDFRIIDRKVVNVLKQMPEHNKFLRGQISWIGFKQTYVEYDRKVRQAGSTGYTYKKMIRLALDGITSFSNFPLKVASICGFVVSGIAFMVMIYALYSRYITKDYVEGWTSTIISVLFLGGIQLISIGIIGEYISRLSENARNRPLYIINETNIKKEA
jgi:dolichol-phosphate mannosyltransferase